MAEYYSLLSRAITSLPNSNAQTRRVVYDRARRALSIQLGRSNPFVSEKELEEEREALEESISQLEAEITGTTYVPKKNLVSEEISHADQDLETPPIDVITLSSIEKKEETAGEETLNSDIDSDKKKSKHTHKRIPFPRDSAQTTHKPDPFLPLSSSSMPKASPFATFLATNTPSHSTGAQVEDTLLLEKKEETIQTHPIITPSATAFGAIADEMVIDTNLHRASTSTPSVAEISPASPLMPPILPAQDLLGEELPLYGQQNQPKENTGFLGLGAALPSFLKLRAPPSVQRADPPAPSTMPSPTEASQESSLSQTTKISDLGRTGLLRKYGNSQMEPPVLRASQNVEPDTTSSFSPAPPPPRIPAHYSTINGRSRSRGWLIGIGVLSLMAAVGITAYVLRDQPNKFVPVRVTSPEKPQATSKISGRANNNIQTNVMSSDGTPVPGSTSTQAAPQPYIPISQRAGLLMQSPTPNDSRGVQTFIGTVVWRLDNSAVDATHPKRVAVVADIDMPQAKLKATMIFKKNEDTTLPASHVIDIRFFPLPGSSVPAIKQIEVPQLRREDTAEGDGLMGVVGPVFDNIFHVALVKSDMYLLKNLELIRSRGWFDIPMVLNDGKIAKITFEKGTSGEKVLDEAARIWQQP